MKAIYLVLCVVGFILLFAVESSNVNISLVGLVLCFGSAYKLGVFDNENADNKQVTEH